MIQSLRTSGSVAILSLLFPPSCSSLLRRLLCRCVCLILPSCRPYLLSICLMVNTFVCTLCRLLPSSRLLPLLVACLFFSLISLALRCLVSYLRICHYTAQLASGTMCLSGLGYGRPCAFADVGNALDTNPTLLKSVYRSNHTARHP